MKRAQPDGISDSAAASSGMTFDFDPGRQTIVVDVVEAVSAIAGVEAQQFEPRLYEAIDPDALTRLIQSGGDGVSVSFELGEYQVTIRGRGEIEVADL
jgi:hypothetical protein